MTEYEIRIREKSPQDVAWLLDYLLKVLPHGFFHEVVLVADDKEIPLLTGDEEDQQWNIKESVHMYQFLLRSLHQDNRGGVFKFQL